MCSCFDRLQFVNQSTCTSHPDEHTAEPDVMCHAQQPAPGLKHIHSFIHSFMFFVYLLFSMTECYHKFPKLQQAQTKIWFGGEVTHVLTSYRCCFHITWNSVPFELFYFCKCCYCYEASCCSFHSLIQKYGKISRGLMRTCCVNRHAVNISSNFLIRHYPCFAKLQLIWTPLECWTMW